MLGNLVMIVRFVARMAVVLAIAGPAAAQTELAGSWAARNHEDALERGGGPYAVDYSGLPLNDEGRARALSYSGDQLSLIEHQCGGWPPFYLAMGPFGMKIWNETDPTSGTTIAWKIGAWEDRAGTTIWMAVRIRRKTHRTSAAASRRVSGRARRLSRTRRT